ncbi:nucleotide pyrophosphohydrolase [Enterococcus lemanii]|uniref:Nucleotide pyrophosphohydrolase n=1 Tax=Enterococcus lemanii TaxID=1159752 RepID=A0ABV9MSS4_9ENTE|nr:nucleotide pyrophosphohydrolase [Enterococcus lemanii]MBM7709379.1 NTP pyrophosphatase (non-canonical NTP hydrolase) [Enterococcus lemanii]
MEKENKTLATMQSEVDDYIQQFKAGYFSPLTLLARLTEEVGELAREVNHNYGEKTKKISEPAKEVAEELTDVLITTIIMANALEIDLTQAFETNMAKFRQRDHFRFERKDGMTEETKKGEEK